MERNDESTELDVDASSTGDGESAEVRSFDVQRELEYARLRAQVSVAAVVRGAFR